MAKSAERVMALYMGLADEDRQEFHMSLHEFEKAQPGRKQELRESFAERAGVALEPAESGNYPRCRG